ncbi:macrophage mannose receptor 1 [Sinocyclocheilus grahami]|uniref:macrophage mannose receptor 1 n=1 Tax=Sinocyclocheilus grahami TaxID=75366 RepID=UPI0007ACCAC4|nr:PREDICTED: macrophage mannose receptor 1-like [Sinocyclocheilus grahami]
MDQKLLLILMIGGIHCVTGLYASMESSKNYYFVNESKTFAEAQRYCRENYIDLVTLEDWTDMEELLALENVMSTESAWIGLRKAEYKQWRWADPELYKDGETEYRNWGPKEPTNLGPEYCSVMDFNGKFRDTTCETGRSFICNEPDLYGQIYSKYVLVNKLKSWRDAQSYCRQYHTELVSVRNEDENLQIQQLIPAESVTYIGLFKDAFVWSDNSTSSLRNWQSGQPDGSGDCVVHLRHSRLWDDQKCSDASPFFCYDRTVVRQILRLKVESDQNVNDPDVKAAILEEIKQKLISQGMSVHANLQWKQQANGDVFQRE